MIFVGRIIAAFFIILMLIFSFVVAILPFTTIAIVQNLLEQWKLLLEQWQMANPTNFMIGQATLGIVVIFVLGVTLWTTGFYGRSRGAVIHTVGGGSAVLDTNSIARRLEWHLEQVADVNNVVPLVKARSAVVDIRLEVEVAPDVDIPMKTDEMVILTRHVIEDDIGLKLGKLDVHLRYAPNEPAYV